MRSSQRRFESAESHAGELELGAGVIRHREVGRELDVALDEADAEKQSAHEILRVIPIVERARAEKQRERRVD